MPFSRLERKLVRGVAGLFIAPTLVAGAVLVLLARAGLFEANRDALAAALVVGCSIQLVYVTVVAWILSRVLVRRLHAIRLGAELMATVNPDHRVAMATDDEFQSVADEINRMADRLQHARTGLLDEVARATEAVTVERGKLSAVLESLAEGVVLVTPDGRVSLANTAATALLGEGGASLLGRSLFELVDHEKVTHFVERLRSARGGVERFTLHPASGALLETAMTPFFDGAGTMSGAILVLRDVTRTARADEERQRRVSGMLRTLRGPLASIRSLSESLLGDADAATDVRRRMLVTLHEEALRLSSLVAATESPEGLELASAPRHFETIAIADLAAMALRRLAQEHEAGTQVSVEAAAELPPLRVEASALSGALGHVLRAVLERADPAGARLRAVQRGAVLQLDVGGSGRGEVSELEARLDLPLKGVRAGPLTVREIVRDHAGEVWAYAGRDQLGFRLTFPIESQEPATAPELARHKFVGAGTVSASGARPAGAARPDFYDFTLFERMARSLRASDLGRSLGELDCVVFDCEMTGLNVDDDRIVSVAAVKVRQAAVKQGEIFDALVHPRRSIPRESIEFHGITDAMVETAPPIDVVLPAFLRFAGDAVLVGHQVWFDLRFLEREARRLGLPPLTAGRPALDTLVLSEIVHGPLGHHGLDVIAGRLGVDVHGRHSALGDALVTAEIFVRLVALLTKRGFRTLGDVLEATRRVRDRAAWR